MSLSINHFLTWRDNYTIVIDAKNNAGVQFIDDVEEDFSDDIETGFCEICNKPLDGKKQKRFCSPKCVGINCSRARLGVKKAGPKTNKITSQ